MNTVLNNGHHSAAPQTAPAANRPDPQVTQRATRRSFTAADKLRILAEAENCKQPGQLGALLRREGLYSSTLANFRRQRDEGKLGKDLHQVRQQRRDKEAARQRDIRKIATLEAENKKLKILLDLQKKVAELMSLSQESLTNG
jgi:transposase-like protein